jgi:hypothetical protein
VCQETKTVDKTNYALSNKAGTSLRGWTLTCRQCHTGASGAQKRLPARAGGEALDFQTLIDMMYEMVEGQPRDRVVEQLREKFEEYGDDPHAQFRAFIRILKPLVAAWKEPGPVHDDIIDGLVTERTNELIMATRNTAKSTLTCMWVAMRIYLYPLQDVLIVSKSSGLAKRNLKTVRAWISGCPFLAHLDPSLNPECLDSAEEFNVPQAHGINTGGSTMVSLGLTSRLTGRRAHVVICDDIEGPDDNTPEKVSALEERQNEIEHVCHPGGLKRTLGTPQSEYSLYAQQAVGDVWHLTKALMFEVIHDEKGKETYSSRWPDRFTDEELLKKKRSMTKRQWDLHWMLICDPKKLMEKPLKLKDMILFDWPVERLEFPLTLSPGLPATHTATDVPTWGVPEGDVWVRPSDIDEAIRPFAFTAAAIDPASGLAGRDAIGVAVVSVTQGGQGVVRHVEGVRGVSLEANIIYISKLLQRFGVHKLVIEEKADSLFGKTLCDELVKRGWPLTPEAVKAGQAAKGSRIIDALAPVMAARRLVMLEDVARSEHGGELVNQMVSCSYDGRIGAKYDDILDALAHCVNSIGPSLTGDRLEGLIAARVDLTNLYDKSIREGGVKAGDLTEKYLEISEAEQKMQAKLDHFLEVRDSDMRSGRHDPYIASQIEKLYGKLRKLRFSEAGS